MGRAGRICLAAPKEPPPVYFRRGLFLIAVSSGSLDQAVQQGQALTAVQLADGLGLDLADTLTGNTEVAAHLLQRAGAAIVQTKRRRMTFSSRGVRLLRA